MAKRMRRTQVLLTEDQHRRFRRLARERRRSLGSLIREAMEQYEPGPSPEERAAAAQRIITANLDLPPFDADAWDEEYARLRGAPCEAEGADA